MKKSDVLRSRAEARLKKGMESESDAFRKDPVALVQELMVHQIELEMQNEELSRAQTEAHELYQRFQDLYDFAPVCYLTLDRGGMIREANMTTASLLEVARSTLVNSPFGQFLVSPSWSSFQEFISQVFASEGGKTCELELTWGRGATKKSALFEGIAVAATKEGEREVRIALLDITARRKAEELLKLSEARYRALYRLSARPAPGYGQLQLPPCKPARERVLRSGKVAAELESAVRLEVLDVEVPVIAKHALIAYKRRLDRDVDRRDIAAMESTPSTAP